MKVVILAGGLGTRISEESVLRPKPMVEIGGKPILWHIMKSYASWGYKEFVLCLGYKGYVIKEYFYNYFLHHADATLSLENNKITFLNAKSEPWTVHLVDTGESTMTGGRVKKIADFIRHDEMFFLTYGDAVSNINIPLSLAAHKRSGKLATLTAVSPPPRFGNLTISGHEVRSFKEKIVGSEGLINGGFFVLSPQVLEYIDGDDTIWEEGPLNKLVSEKNLNAYLHTGFWQPMDTIYERNLLEKLWQSGDAPWKTWD